jgi:hypothetical protein
MRLLALTLATLLKPSLTIAQTETKPPDFCYVAQVALIVEAVDNYRFDRVVVDGIRTLPAAPDATAGNCEPKSAEVAATMRRRVDAQLDSTRVEPPRVRSNIQIRHARVDVVQSEIRRLATKAREHRGAFVRVELVQIDEVDDRHALPRLSIDDTDARDCAAANVKLEQARAKFRWAC